MKIIYVFSDGPCKTCAWYGHPLEEIEQELHGFHSVFMWLTESTYRDVLEGKQCYSRCGRVEGMMKMTEKDKKPVKKTSAKMEIYKDKQEEVCAAVHAIPNVDDRNCLENEAKRELDEPTVLKIYHVGSYLPCPFAVKGTISWFMLRDKRRFNEGAQHWNVHVDQKQPSALHLLYARPSKWYILPNYANRA